eukprot:9029640-Lingulodinium_polyedra.AAC.1
MTFGAFPRCLFVRASCAAACGVGRGAAVCVVGRARVGQTGRQSGGCGFGSRLGVGGVWVGCGSGLASWGMAWGLRPRHGTGPVSRTHAGTHT